MSDRWLLPVLETPFMEDGMPRCTPFEIALNKFTVDGHKVDISKITTVAVMTVEGEEDDISAPGQCVAALDLCTGLAKNKKSHYNCRYCSNNNFN